MAPIQGLNNSIDEYSCPIQFTPDCLNVYRNGMMVEKRDGYLKVNTSAISGAPGILSQAHFQQDAGGVDQYIIHASDGKIYKLDGASFTEIRAGRSLYQPSSFAVFQNTLIITDGENPVLSWDGASMNELDNAPRGKYVIHYNRHLFMLNIPGNHSHVRVSDIDDMNTWTATNVFKIESNNNDPITGAGIEGRYLWIFKNDMKLPLYGNDFDQDSVTFDAQAGEPEYGNGCRGAGSIVNVRGGLYYADENGLWYQRGGETIEVTRNVKALWRRVSFIANNNNPFSAIHYPNLKHYMLFCCLDGGEDLTHIIVHDYENDSIWLYSMTGKSLGFKEEDDDTVGIYLGDNAGFIHRLFNGITSDNGAAFNSYCITAPFEGSDYRIKHFNECAFYLKNTGSNDLAIEQWTDSNTTYKRSTNVRMTLDSGSITLQNSILEKSISLSNHGRKAQWKLTNNNANQRWGFIRLVPKGYVESVER